MSASVPRTELNPGNADEGRLLAMQFDDAQQQDHAAHLGMWLFLATEVLFFGGMLIAYTFYRISDPAAFATGSGEMAKTLGTINTAILLTSSLFVALAHRSIEAGKSKQTIILLIITMVFGVAFLGLKFTEYAQHIEHGLFPGPNFNFSRIIDHPGDPRHVEIFFFLYFTLTGVHALHMMIGCCLFMVITILTWRGHVSARSPNPVIIGGLYWHFVDIVWVFLYPLIYLIR